MPERHLALDETVRCVQCRRAVRRKASKAGLLQLRVLHFMMLGNLPWSASVCINFVQI